MNGEEFIFFGIIGVSFVVSLVLSFFFGKRQNKLGLSIMGILWAGFTAILFFGMYSATGWDAMGYALFLMGVSAPTGVGSLIGGLFGWAKSGNEKHEESSSGARHAHTASAPR